MPKRKATAANLVSDYSKAVHREGMKGLFGDKALTAGFAQQETETPASPVKIEKPPPELAGAAPAAAAAATASSSAPPSTKPSATSPETMSAAMKREWNTGRAEDGTHSSPTPSDGTRLTAPMQPLSPPHSPQAAPGAPRLTGEVLQEGEVEWAARIDMLNQSAANKKKDEVGELVETVVHGVLSGMQLAKPQQQQQDEQMSEKERFLKEASEQGGRFNMRERVGQWWAKAIAEDSDLKKEYQAVGKSFAAQRAFRDRWCKKEFEIAKAQRLQEEVVANRDELAGTYYSASRIWVEEGKDASALKATCNYVKMAIEKHQNNEQLNGRPYVIWNSWTKCYKFLYITQSFNDSYTHKQRNIHEEKPVEINRKAVAGARQDPQVCSDED